MTRIHRILLVAITAVLVVAIASPAFASDATDEGSDADTTSETAEAVPISAGDGPAVIVPPTETEAVEQPWTARYMIPFFVISAALLVLGVVVLYTRSIRSRYKVVA